MGQCGLTDGPRATSDSRPLVTRPAKVFVRLLLSSSSYSSRALQSVVDLGFQYIFPPFLTVLSHCTPISYYHDFQILFSLIYLYFTWSSSFPYSFHFSCHYFLGILSLFILSICPHHLNLRDFINFTISAPSSISSISLLLASASSFIFLTSKDYKIVILVSSAALRASATHAIDFKTLQ
jgi:hypothetical protein